MALVKITVCLLEKGQYNKISAEKQIILQPCTLVKPACMNAVESEDGWSEVRFMVDSGANDTVIPPEELPQIPSR